MKTTALRPFAILVGIAVLGVTAFAMSLVSGFQNTGGNNAKSKTLRESVLERDVERNVREGPSTSEYRDIQNLVRASTAIVLGRVQTEESQFVSDDEITTVYTVEVQRVIKDGTLQAAQMSQALNRMLPAPLTPTLTFKRFGGTVMVNGHRASVLMKGRGGIKSGKTHVFFLEWSGKNYYLVGGMSGAFLVSNKSLLEPLGSDQTLYATYAGQSLEVLVEHIRSSPTN